MVAEKKGVALLPVSTLMVAQQPGIVAVPLNPRVTLEVVFAMRRGEERSSQMKELIEMIKQEPRRYRSNAVFSFCMLFYALILILKPLIHYNVDCYGIP